MRENLVYLIPSEDDRKARRLLRPFHSVQPTKFLLKNVFIKKEQRAERLILGGGRHPAITGEMGKKRAHFRFTFLWDDASRENGSSARSNPNTFFPYAGCSA